MAVLTKKQNYRLWRAGAFGNKLRAWTVEEWVKNRIGRQFEGLVAIRTLQAGGGPCAYNCLPWEVLVVVDHWCDAGIPVDDIMINEMATEATPILQGEFFNGVLQDEEGFALPGYFFYSAHPSPMRDALRAAGQHTYGLRADTMIRNAMTDSSYEDWKELLDLYPDHVLEVSIFNHCLGDIPNRNALVWEVRRY